MHVWGPDFDGWYNVWIMCMIWLAVPGPEQLSAAVIWLHMNKETRRQWKEVHEGWGAPAETGRDPRGRRIMGGGTHTSRPLFRVGERDITVFMQVGEERL